MNDYFEHLERDLRTAVRECRHLPWHARLRLRHSRALVVVLAAIVIAGPAVAAVTGLLKTGSPVRFGAVSAIASIGRAMPHGGDLLPLRVPDPDGGPPWGLRLIRTTRGDTCVQLGRVQNGQIGAIGIDGAFHDDHRFHPIAPNDYYADYCGTTDANGYGFVNVTFNGAPASTPFTDSCRLAGDNAPQSDPICPQGSQRFIFLGLLGPEARSITYLTPDGRRVTEPTSSGIGAYLLVFRQDTQSCATYFRRSVVPPRGGSACGGGFSPNTDLTPGAIVRIDYTDGHTCQLPAPNDPRRLAVARAIRSSLRRGMSRAETLRVVNRILASYHVRSLMTLEYPTCQPVGYAAPRTPHVTQADVASPVRVQVLPARFYCSLVKLPQTWIPCNGRVPAGYERINHGDSILIQVTYTARIAVRNDNSAYEYSAQYPCNGGGSGYTTHADIRAGQRMTIQDFVTPKKCLRPYQVTIAFVPATGPGGSEQGGGGLAGRNGSIIVGRTSFRIPRSG